MKVYCINSCRMPAGIRGSKEAICADIFCSIAAYVCVPANFHFSSESDKVRKTKKKTKKRANKGVEVHIKEDSYLSPPPHRLCVSPFNEFTNNP